MKSFVPFIIIAICVGMYFMYISPLITDIEGLRAKKAEYVGVLEKAKDVKIKRDAALQAYNNIPEEDISKLDKIVPTKFDGVRMLNDLSVAVSRYGLTLMDFSTNQSGVASRDSSASGTDPGQHNVVGVNVRIVGPYDQFIRFLKDVETNLQLVDVTGISITAGSSSNNNQKVQDNNSLQYVLEFNTYSLK
jgi:Tfp pilus assembly protein PilO